MQTHPARHRRLPGATRPLTRLAVLAFVVGLIGLASTAQAQAPADACAQASTILQNAYPGARPDPDQRSYLLGKRRLMMPGQSSADAPSMVCKVWPAHDKLLLVAVPSMDGDAPLDNDRVGDLDILVVDRGSLKVQQRLNLPDAMSDDAIRIEQLDFDTARYVIAPGIQAFGMRTTRNGASRANPFNETSLRLLAMRDGGSGPLRVVLDSVSTSRSGGEWDTNCAGDFSERKATLAMATELHNGFYDIRVTQSGEDTKAAPAGKDKTDCKETIVKAGKTQTTLSYDGKRYAVTEDLKGM